MNSLLNAMIGEYRIVESLGAGGMGEVYKAVHTHLHRVIAVKVLSPNLADGPALKRFYGEAKIQASLRHPGVAEYLGMYEYNGRPCILLEYVDGDTLSTMVRRRGALVPEEAIRIVREIAAVVATFHAGGLIHRDLKSSNVKINSAGRVKILDFGIALHQRSDRLTRAGAVIGTPESLAPEQIRGEPATPATDVWQIGVLFYELLTGTLPFQGATHELYARILDSGIVRPAGVPPAVVKIVSRCLEKVPARRYRSAAELCRALSCAAPARSRLPGRALSMVAAAALALLVAAWLVVRSIPHGAPVAPMAVERIETGRGDARTVTVDTMDGVAEVYREGRRIGVTPLNIDARPGERVDLVLRRSGYHDLPLQFEPTERHSFTYTLERIKER